MMTKQEYQALDSLRRKIRRMEGESFEVWTAVAARLLQQEIDKAKLLLAAHRREILDRVILLESANKSLQDRYAHARWISRRILAKYGYHDEEKIRYFVEKIKEYHWSHRDLSDIPF